MLGVVGSLSLDVVDGEPPRPGGAVYYAAQALQLLDVPARIVAKCAAADRVELGVATDWLDARTTTAFAFSYDGDDRTMTVLEVGEPWRPAEADALVADVEWLHVGGLLRSDFPPDTIEALARGRRLSLDGQALVRRGERGPLRIDGDVDRGVLEAAQILTLSEEEADVLGSVDVPEVVVTLGSRGSILRAGGGEHRIDVEVVRGVDPTGAGESPLGAARRASELVTELLSRR